MDVLALAWFNRWVRGQRNGIEDYGPVTVDQLGTGDVLSRTTWLLVAGAGVRENVVFDRAVDSTDLVPTLGAMMGFNPSLAQGKPISEVL